MNDNATTALPRRTAAVEPELATSEQTSPAELERLKRFGTAKRIRVWYADPHPEWCRRRLRKRRSA